MKKGPSELTQLFKKALTVALMGETTKFTIEELTKLIELDARLKAEMLDVRLSNWDE